MGHRWRETSTGSRVNLLPFAVLLKQQKSAGNRFKKIYLGQPRWLSGLTLPSAQGMILETGDRAPHRAPCMEPASPSICASLSVSFMIR